MESSFFKEGESITRNNFLFETEISRVCRAMDLPITFSQELTRLYSFILSIRLYSFNKWFMASLRLCWLEFLISSNLYLIFGKRAGYVKLKFFRNFINCKKAGSPKPEAGRKIIYLCYSLLCS